MESTNNDDRLLLADLPEYKKILSEEKLLFSEQIIKINRLLNEDRGILITDKAFYNIKKRTTIRRRTELKALIGITITNISDEFILHVAEADDDYHYSSPLKNKIADLFSDSIGVEEQDPHPYNMDVNVETKEVTANEKRLSYNGVTIDYKSTEYPKYEKIAFNSLVDRAKSMKASLILIIPQNQSPLFFDELNGTMVVKQELQNYFMKNTNGRGFYCYTIDSFLREIQKCRAIEIPPQIFTSISICSQFSRQECKFIGNNWYER